MLGDPGEIVPAQLRREKQLRLKVRTTIGKAFFCERWSLSI